ncbi:MAG: zinc-ribbon domain-containing protein [Velocimicrobium sp.]
MSFCPNCGNEVQEENLFCANCGKALKESNASKPSCQTEHQEKKKSTNEFIRKNKKILWIGFLTVIILIFVLVIRMLLIKSNENTLLLNGYMKIHSSGYNTVGTAESVFDYKSFERDLKNILETTSSSKVEALIDASLNEYYVSDIEDMIKFELNKSQNLSNGDKVTLHFVFDNKKLKKYNIKLKAKDIKSKVNGLLDIKKVNPFDYITVKYTGVSPGASAEVVNNSSEEFFSSLNFTFKEEHEDCLRIGDTITLSIMSDDEQYALQNGYQFTETSKKYSCDSLDTYAMSMSDISDETLEYMKNKTVETLEDTLDLYDSKAKKWNYEGCYFLVSKNIDTWGATNSIYVVYSTTLKSSYEDLNNEKIYFPIRFLNIVKHSDGTSSVDDKFYYGASQWINSFADFPGYDDTEAMYYYIIERDKADFAYEVTDGLKKYGE